MTAINGTQRQKLLEHLRLELQKIHDQLDNIEQQAEPVSSVEESGRVGRSAAIQNQQMALAQKHRLEERLTQIQKALQLAEEGNYGFCTECGNAIRYERLIIKPEVAVCITCQERMEKEDQ